ncbi:ABC transporter ATP-binding protein [Caldisericum exile]|uniref:ABC transporter ATP-binding protein n=1 Tax=Caldisericum exile (strain DSM 21853 / NBRC 104410 / AZM16c01) TaxID=511051 RepID=A0A7U6JE05_CALEA|nr:ABC transporter ATP-binding protein [Caldisericum exile]BAL80226.1 putative ABC transporter ATP-binding protein [Caldisericum exile AZM16c01]
MEKVLTVLNLLKIYPNGKNANNGINIDVNRGEIVGLIGPNGAGKTTLVRQILGLLKPTGGTISILGEDISLQPSIIKREVGYAPQYPLYFPSLTVEETIGFALRLKGFKGEQLTNKLNEIIDFLNLGQVRKYYGYQLSPGLIKLMLIGVAFAQARSLLILDEPTSMVDIVSKSRLWDRLSQFKNNKAILIASHDMNEIKKLADRVYVILDGKIIAEGSPREISLLLELPCNVIFSSLDALRVKSFLEDNHIVYSLGGSVFTVSVGNLNSAIDIIKQINDITPINYIQFEAPSFETAIRKILEEKNGQN